MANPNISAALTSAQKNTMKSNVNANKAIINPFGVNLTMKERKSKRKTGSCSLGYVEDALHIGQENPGVVPPDFTIAEFAKDAALLSDLDEIIAHHNSYIEMLNDTRLAVGSECKRQADHVYALVKIAAKTDSAMDENRKKLKAHFHRKPKAGTGGAGNNPA